MMEIRPDRVADQKKNGDEASNRSCSERGFSQKTSLPAKRFFYFGSKEKILL